MNRPVTAVTGGNGRAGWYHSTALQLPFAHLNLRINPFGEATQEERVQLAVVDTDRWVQWLTAPRRAVQFIGASGRGKSTHVLALNAAMRPHCNRIAHVRIKDDGKAEWPDVDVFAVDEIQFVPKRIRAALFRRQCPLILGTHDDLSRELNRRGYEVQTVHLRSTDAPTIHEVLRRRMEWARRGPGPVPMISDDTVQALIQLHGDDVRAMEDTLYERIQAMKEIDHVRV